MKRHWIEYAESRPHTPMRGWVHRRVRIQTRSKDTELTPPLPDPVIGKGYPTFMVEIDGFTFKFASLEEIRVCIGTLEQKHLPRYRGLSRVITRKPRPNRHWLNQLPGEVLRWRYREKAVRYLRKALGEFETGKVS